jgi:hypothetical protein
MVRVHSGLPVQSPPHFLPVFRSMLERQVRFAPAADATSRLGSDPLLSEKLLIDRLAESLISYLQAYAIHDGFCIRAAT